MFYFFFFNCLADRLEESRFINGYGINYLRDRLLWHGLSIKQNEIDLFSRFHFK